MLFVALNGSPIMVAHSLSLSQHNLKVFSIFRRIKLLSVEAFRQTNPGLVLCTLKTHKLILINSYSIRSNDHLRAHCLFECLIVLLHCAQFPIIWADGSHTWAGLNDRAQAGAQVIITPDSPGKTPAMNGFRASNCSHNQRAGRAWDRVRYECGERHADAIIFTFAWPPQQAAPA